jgi:hypothetical protein
MKEEEFVETCVVELRQYRIHSKEYYDMCVRQMGEDFFKEELIEKFVKCIIDNNLFQINQTESDSEIGTDVSVKIYVGVEKKLEVIAKGIK